MTPVLIVTGGGRGIGAACAQLAGERGYAVAVNYNTNAARARAVVGQVEKAGGRAVAVQADVRPRRVRSHCSRRSTASSARSRHSSTTRAPSCRVPG